MYKRLNGKEICFLIELITHNIFIEWVVFYKIVFDSSISYDKSLNRIKTIFCVSPRTEKHVVTERVLMNNILKPLLHSMKNIYGNGVQKYSYYKFYKTRYFFTELYKRLFSN